MTPSSNINPEYRADVQGLRAIAVIGVILFHANRNFLSGGFVGVDVFLVISGFLIGGIVLRKKSEGRFSFSDFYLDRLRRIVPAYLVMLAAVTFISALLLTPKDFKFYWACAKSALFFASNTYFAGFGSYFAPSGHELPLLHTWSLAIEMQFYLVLPLLLVLFPERYIKPMIALLILALVGFGASLMEVEEKKAAYFSLLVRTPEFLVGVFMAAMARSKAWNDRLNSLGHGKDGLSLLGLVLILYSFIAIDETSQFPGFLIAYPCVGAALVIAGRGGRVSLFLSCALMVWIGGLSYSLYLWHWPVFAIVRYVNEQYEFAYPLLVILLLILTGGSYISLRWIETPFRNKQWFSGTTKLRTVALFLGIIAPIMVSPRLNAAVEPPLSIAYTRYADPDRICHGRVVGDCVRRAHAVSDALPVLVLGDSHAAQLNLFFDHVGERTGKRFRVISASSCVTIPGFDVDRIPDYSRQDCRNSIEYAKRFLPESSEIIIAAMWQYQPQSKEFVAALNEFLSQTQSAGKRVTLLWQIPMLSSDVQRLRRFEALGLRSDIRIHEEWAGANKIASEIAGQYANVRFLEFSWNEMFKTPPFYREELVYHDNHHLNEVGAVKYSDIAATAF